jgi:hypothetical protein
LFRQGRVRLAQADGGRRFVACPDERGNAPIVAGESALREAIADAITENVDDADRPRAPRRLIRTESCADGVAI